MVHGIAQQVGERRFELLQHIAVDLGVLTFYVQAHLLAEGTAEIAQHARLADEHIGERAHARGQRGVVHQLRALATLPAELIEVGHMPGEHLLALAEQLPGLGQHGAGGASIASSCTASRTPSSVRAALACRRLRRCNASPGA